MAISPKPTSRPERFPVGRKPLKIKRGTSTMRKLLFDFVDFV